MKSTADRYREAGMPPPRGEVSVTDIRRAARKAPRRTIASSPLPERVFDPADGPVLPEIDPAAYGPDSVPLDTPDANTTEEQS